MLFSVGRVFLPGGLGRKAPRKTLNPDMAVYAAMDYVVGPCG